MSLSDGNMNNDYLYATSDISLAAYLVMSGYELLGAFDNGKIGNNGRRLKEFGLTHTDPYVLADMMADISKKADEYRYTFYKGPGEEEAKLNFWVHYKTIKQLHHALDEAIKSKE
jgi:hypothetical protein